MVLSGAGVGLSSTTFINGTDSMAKSTIKYVERFPCLAEKGVMKKFLSGKVSPKESEKLYDLLKKTNGAYPGPPVVLPALTT